MAIFLLSFVLFNLLIATILFIFNVGIQGWYLPCSFVFSAFLTILLMKHRRMIRAESIFIVVVLPVLTILGLIVVNGKIYDYTWDGNNYHKLAIGMMIDGWNPLMETEYEFNDKNEEKEEKINLGEYTNILNNDIDIICIFFVCKFYVCFKLFICIFVIFSIYVFHDNFFRPRIFKTSTFLVVCFYSKYLDKAINKKIHIDKDFNLSFEEYGEYHSQKHLSFGQTAMCNLCIRLALIDNMFSGNIPFVILDDPFIGLDDENFSDMKKLICDLSKDRQLIYFTCHESRKIKGE